MNIQFPNDSKELEAQVHYISNVVKGIYYRKNREEDQVFNQANPTLIYYLIGLSIILFGFMESQGGSTSIDVLIHFSAKYNPAIIQGEW